MKRISICIPAYNEAENIVECFQQINAIFLEKLSDYLLEIVFVNDGSTDETLMMMQKVANTASNIKIVDLSRNYGKEIAIFAGIHHCDGDATVIMDSDLQHPPAVIPDMLKLWEIGYKDVYGKRVTRKKESWFKIHASKGYYKLLGLLTKQPVEDGVGDFRLLDKECLEALKQVKDKQRYTKGMYNWIGYKKIAVEFEAEERFAGETKWKTADLVKLGIDGITSNSVQPLKISTYLGFLISFLAFIYLIYTLINGFLGKTSVDGYSSLMAVILILGGIQLITIGIVGEYLGKVFNEVKDRPIYLINKASSKLQLSSDDQTTEEKKDDL